MTFPRNTDLLVNQTSNIADPTPIPVDGANLNIAVWGTFDSGTVSLEGSPDGGTTWIQILLDDGSPAQFTTNILKAINTIKTGIWLRATLSGATSPNINAKIY